MIDLLNLYCIFSRKDGTYARNFKFGDSNKIIDINSDGNDNERFWCQSGDKLYLYNKNNVQTSEFQYDEATSDENYSCFYGKWNKSIGLRIIAAKCLTDLNTTLSRFLMHDLVSKRLVSVKKHTVGQFKVISSNSSYKITVGDYTTFKNNVSCVFPSLLGISITNFGENQDNISENKMLEINIENDVLIYDGVQINQSVTIHNGAIILPFSVVTCDVPPYAIAQGSPASIIGYRFSEDKCIAMQNIAWWNWDEDKILSHKNDFNSLDIEHFINKFLK